MNAAPESETIAAPKSETTVAAESEVTAVVDAILARAALPVTPEDYARLLALYPALQAQAASLRIAELRDLEPAVVYPARPES